MKDFLILSLEWDNIVLYNMPKTSTMFPERGISMAN